MYFDTPGKIMNTMEERLKKTTGGRKKKQSKKPTQVDKNYHLQRKNIQVLIWNSRCKENPDFKISINTANKLKISQKTLFVLDLLSEMSCKNKKKKITYWEIFMKAYTINSIVSI